MKTHTSLEPNKNLQREDSSQYIQNHHQINQPSFHAHNQKPLSPLRNQKQSNLAMIRQKIVTGQPSHNQNHENREGLLKMNNPIEMTYSQSIPVRNYSPAPNIPKANFNHQYQPPSFSSNSFNTKNSFNTNNSFNTSLDSFKPKTIQDPPNVQPLSPNRLNNFQSIPSILSHSTFPMANTLMKR